MSLLATIRPDAWNLPLFVHVLGAMVLVGAAATGVGAAFASGPAAATGWTARLAYRTFLLAALPAFVVMRVGAEWIRSKEFGSGTDPHFVIVGYTAADFGGVLLVVGIVLSWYALRRKRPRLTKAAAIVIGVAFVGWLVAVWAMGAKPS